MKGFFWHLHVVSTANLWTWRRVPGRNHKIDPWWQRVRGGQGSCLSPIAFCYLRTNLLTAAVRVLGDDWWLGAKLIDRKVSSKRPKTHKEVSRGVIMNRFSCLTPGLDWTRLFMSLTAGAGTRCMSLLPDSPTLGVPEEKLERRPCIRNTQRKRRKESQTTRD